MVFFENCSVYISSRTTLEAKIAAIDAIITALYAQMLVLATQDSPVQEYLLNDGQTTIKAMYRSEASISKTIDILNKQRNELINQLNGRVVRMVDSKNFIPPGWGNY